MIPKLIAGCAAVAGFVAGGLCPDCGAEPRSALGEMWNRPSAISEAPRALADTAVARLAIQGMTCGSCATTARLALQKVEGVYRARVSYDSAAAVVWYDPKHTSPPTLIAKLKELTGYAAKVIEQADSTITRPPLR